MKSAYELAMERLNKTSPSVKLTAEQKAQIADLESRYKAKIAERELALNPEIAQAASQGDFENVEKLQQRLAAEKRALQAEFEDKKEKVRKGSVD